MIQSKNINIFFRVLHPVLIPIDLTEPELQQQHRIQNSLFNEERLENRHVINTVTGELCHNKARNTE